MVRKRSALAATTLLVCGSRGGTDTAAADLFHRGFMLSARSL